MNKIKEIWNTLSKRLTGANLVSNVTEDGGTRRFTC